MTKRLQSWGGWDLKGVTYSQALVQRDREMNAEMPPDTRAKCVEDGCEEKVTGGQCAAHVADGVL